MAVLPRIYFLEHMGTFRELMGIPPVEYREKALMQNANKQGKR